jgi:hypothetical protein
MKWQYQIDVGLKHQENNAFDLLFGTHRAQLRERFNYSPGVNKGRFEAEDSYDSFLGDNTQWFRLGFDNDKLFEIEVLAGEVVFDNIVIRAGTDLNAVLNKMAEKGYRFKEWDYGFINHEIKIDLGDSEKNGGQANLIYWILLLQTPPAHCL